MPKVRPLTVNEVRELEEPKIDLQPYVDALRDTVEGKLYEFTPDEGVNPSAARRRLRRAAKSLGKGIIFRQKTGERVIFSVYKEVA
jgi:hypothetical protein